MWERFMLKFLSDGSARQSAGLVSLIGRQDQLFPVFSVVALLFFCFVEFFESGFCGISFNLSLLEENKRGLKNSRTIADKNVLVQVGSLLWKH